MPRAWLALACFLWPVLLAANPIGQRISDGARMQLVSPARYDASYRRIRYPGGDVPPDCGACTDVVIRAFRQAGYDLQRLVHEDAARAPRAYRRIARLDSNIDHRRVPNLAAFFRRHGRSLPLEKDWRPGDVVTWKLPSNLDHTGVLSGRHGPSGNYLVIHNLSMTAEEDVLRAWTVTGHFRYPG